MTVLEQARKLLIDEFTKQRQWCYDNPDKHTYATFGEKVIQDMDGNDVIQKDFITIRWEYHCSLAKKVNALKRHRVHLNDDKVVEVIVRKKDWHIKTARQTWHLKHGRFGWYLELKK